VDKVQLVWLASLLLMRRGCGTRLKSRVLGLTHGRALQAGYNPKNGKIKALFRWEGTARGELFHPDTGQIVPVLSFARPHSRAFHFAWLNFMLCFVMW
jgi:hypothetical protein